MKLKLTLKRAYEPAERDDGERILVERLWPRGLAKEEAHLDGWLKEIAPSTELRKWYGHVAERWPEFQKRYEAELRAPEKQAQLQDLIARAKKDRVTLVYAAKDTKHNSAVVLKEFLER